MIVLDGKRIPDFVKVNAVDFSILPPLENNLLKVRGKAGSYLFSQDMGTRVFTVSVTIIAERINGVMLASRQVAEWLHHKEPVKLVFDDEPDKYYLVVPDGDTNITETVNIGQGTITFLCTEPYAFGATQEETYFLESEEDVAVIDVIGSVETPPEIELTMKEAITSISISSDEGETLIIGEPASVTQNPVNPDPLVLIDRMDDLEGWERAYQVDGGIIQGQFEANNSRVRVKDKNYGTSSLWHGASMIRELDKPLEDFSVHFGFGLTTKTKQEVGRIELYLLDENNVQFGKIALVDKYNTADKNVFEARAGTWGEGTYFASGYSDKLWDNYYGRILLKRTGRLWEVTISPDENGPYINRYDKTWFDSSDTWNHKLAKIQIHIGTYGTSPPAHDMFITHINVSERLTLDDSDAPIIAIKDDILLIDNSKMVVYLNGEPRFDLINPASNFLTLQKGLNHLSISPAKADMKVTYPERWL